MIHRFVSNRLGVRRVIASVLCRAEYNRNGLNFRAVSQRFMHDIEVNRNVQNLYRKEDNVSDDFHIIYRAPMANYIKISHYVAFGVVTLTPLAMLFSYFVNSGEVEFPIMMGSLPMIRGYFDVFAFSAGLTMFTLQVYIIVLRYPLRIYSNGKGEFLFAFRHFLPGFNRNKTMKSGELYKGQSIMPWGDLLYCFGKNKAYIYEDHFLKPANFNEMMMGESNKEDNKNEN